MAAAHATIPAIFKPLRTIGRSTLGGQIVRRGSPAELDRTDGAYARQFIDARAGGPMTSAV
jgi:hypothetical protein